MSLGDVGDLTSTPRPRVGNVAQIVDDTRGYELSKSDRPERRMLARKSELCLAEPPAAQGVEVASAQHSELVERVDHGFVSALVPLGEAIVSVEANARPLRQDDARARNVGPFAVHDRAGPPAGARNTPGVRSRTAMPSVRSKSIDCFIGAHQRARPGSTCTPLAATRASLETVRHLLETPCHLAFMLVGLAIVALDLVRNPFGVDVNVTLPSLSASSVFWLLLTAYWCCLIAWNTLAKQFDRTKWRPWAQCLNVITLLPFVGSVWASAGSYSFQPTLVGKLSFIWMLV